MNSKKGFIALLFVFVFFVGLLAGCGKGKELSKVERARMKAVEICESFLNYEITNQEANEQLKYICDTLGYEGAELHLKTSIYSIQRELTKKSLITGKDAIDMGAVEEEYLQLKNCDLDWYDEVLGGK